MEVQQQLGAIFADVKAGKLPVAKAAAAVARLQQQQHSAKDGDFLGSSMRSALRRCVDLFLLLPPGQPEGERVLRLLVAVASSAPAGSDAPSSALLWANDGWARFLLRYLLALAGAGEKSVRLRAAQVAALLLDAAAPRVADADDDLLGLVLLKMQERLRDKSAGVREWALRALRRLQRPSSADPAGDVVHGHFLRLMAEDPSDTVRLAAVSCVATSTDAALSALVGRCRDVSPAVRERARRVLGGVAFAALGTAVRVALVDAVASLGDDDAELSELVCNTWIPALSGDVLALLEGIDVAQSEARAERVVRAMLRRPLLRMACRVAPTANPGELTAVFSIVCPLGASEPRTYEEITDELALLWRVYCETFNDPLSDALDEVVPELSLVTEMARALVTGDRPFACRQLLKLVAVVDLYDEVGRRNLDALLQTLLPQMADVPDVVDIAMDVFHRLHPDEGEWARVVVQMLADIRDPIDAEADPQSSQLMEEDGGVAKLSPEKEACIWRGALNILRRFLETTRRDLHDPLVAGVLVSLILPTITHKDPSVRIGGIRALGLYVLLGKSVAREYLFLFLKVLEHDTRDLRKVALQVLLDVIIAHGTAALGITDMLTLEVLARSSWSDDEAQERALVALVGCLNDPDLRSTAAEGLAKLFFVGTLACPEVFARLVVLRFDPAASSDRRLETCLDTFFPTYVFSHRFHDRHQLVAENAFLPSLLFAQSCNIARRNDAQQISVNSVAGLVLKLTGPPPPPLAQRLRGHDDAAHIRMAKTLVEHLLAHPRQATHLADVFLGLDLHASPQESLAEIAASFDSLLSKREIQPPVKKKLATIKELISGKRNAGKKPKKRKEEQRSASGISDGGKTKTPKKRDRREFTEEHEEEEEEDEEPEPKRPSKKAEDETLEETAAAVPEPADSSRRIVVAFAGFHADEPALISAKISELGGDVRGENDALDSEITHMVRPEGAVTTKILVAALLNIWIVSPAWVDASLAAGEFVDEEPFGRRFPPGKTPLAGKRVALLDEYKREPRFDGDFHGVLIENAGRGRIVQDPTSADFLLVPRSMPQEARSEFEKRGVRVLTRTEFFKMLCP